MADATAKLSGYLATESTVSWSTSAAQNLNNDGTGAAALTDNEYTDLSEEIDNSTNKYALADFEIYLSTLSPSGADAGMELFIVPTLDGTNYPAWTGNGTTTISGNTAYIAAWFFVPEGTSITPRLLFRAVPLPPGKFKIAVRNRSNATLATTGNTVKWRPWSYLGDEA